LTSGTGTCHSSLTANCTQMKQVGSQAQCVEESSRGATPVALRRSQ
jgi:hypothetical protein